MENGIIFLGVVYLFIGCIDLFHTLSFKGMMILGTNNDPNPSTQLWVSARYIESISLLVFTFILNRKVKFSIVYSIYFITVIAVLFTILIWPIFPECFIEGSGLTPFKKYSEYLISSILCLALYVLFKKKKKLDHHVYRYLSRSIIATVISELLFTFYISVYGLSNLWGHLFKLISVYFIYKSIIFTGLKQPYSLMKKELIERETRYQQMFETNKAVKLLIDPNMEGLIVDVNLAACNFYGYSKAEFLTKHISDLNLLSTDQLFQKMQDAKLQNQSVFNFKHRLANGDVKDVEVYSGPVIIDKKTLLYSIVQDVTEKKIADQKNRESEEKYKTMIENSNDMIWIIDIEGNIAFFNNQTGIVLDIHQDEWIGKEFTSFIPEQDFQLIMDIFNRTIGGESINYNLRIKKSDNSLLTISVNTAPIKKNDNITGVVSFGRDITKQLELEKQIRQGQKMESLGTFTGGIAHDFNNILFPILGYSDMILNNLSNEDPLRPNIETIYNSANRAKDLINQILTFSRAEKCEFKVMKVQPIIEEALKLICSIIPSTIAIEIQISPDCGAISIDPTQMHQIIMNLVGNAYHSMEKHGGVLKVSFEETNLYTEDLILTNLLPGKFARLRISDTGTGISEEILPHIFEPFFTTKEKGKGTGMGLSVVHGIVKSFGGIILAKSELNIGTEFTISFPILENEHNSSIYNDETLMCRNEKLLIIDDEDSILEMERLFLERLGYRVDFFTKSIDALNHFRSDPEYYDLVITDYTMPEMAGDEFASEVHKFNQNIPIILCTGFNDKITPEYSEKLGIKSILIKPVSLQELHRTIRKSLDNKDVRG